MRPRIALGTMLHHRMELSFFPEWLEYHGRLGVDCIFLGVDVRNMAGDFVSQRLALGQVSKPRRPYVWWKKPHFDYHDELTYAQVIDQWRDGISNAACNELVPVFLRLRKEVTSQRQRRWIDIIFSDYGADFDYLFFIDGDEFLVPQTGSSLDPLISRLDGSELVCGVKQQVFDKRWRLPGENHASVFDITETRGVTEFDNPAPAFAFKCLFGPEYASLDRADIHPQTFVRDAPSAYSTIPEELLLLYHFKGWDDFSHRGYDEALVGAGSYHDHRHLEVFNANSKRLPTGGTRSGIREIYE